MRLIFVLLLLSLLCSCSNDQNVKRINSTNSKKIISKVKNDSLPLKEQNNHCKKIYTDSLLNIIYNIDAKYRSNLINDFFNKSRNISCKRFTSHSLQFYFSAGNYYERENVSFLNTLTKRNIICFNGFVSDSNGIQSHVYFLQKFDGKWINISQFFINNNIISLIENKLKINFSFKKLDEVYSFVSDYTNIPFYFSFGKPAKILYYSDSSWNILSDLILEDGKLSVVDRNNGNEAKQQVLSADELDNCKIYNSINKAVEESQFVYVLDLSSNSMDSLSQKIGLLNNLQVLILNDNNLTHLPSLFLHLRKIQILRINNNKLKRLPAEIGKLKYLQEISASFNDISQLPVSLSKSASLKILNVDHNKLSSFFPDCASLKNLNILNLSHNKIQKLPEDFGDMKNLISIDISNNPIDNLPESFFKIKNIIYLDVTNTKIPDQTLVKIMDIYPDLRIKMD